MSKNLSYGSVCSGIEAASVAWHNYATPAWFSEISKFPSAVLAHHFPTVANLGDMTKIKDKIQALEVCAPDVLVGGTPCQAFSIAGLRGGLADPRGGLSLSFIELANKIDEVRHAKKQKPAFILWENVIGVLSSKDNAFGCFLAGLAGETIPLLSPRGSWPNAGCVVGTQRTIAWRVLDAQYFGLAQRRLRVFALAIDNSANIDPARILFEFEGTRLDSPPRNSSGHPLAPSDGSSPQHPIVIQGNVIGRQPKNGPAGKGYSDSGVCFTLNCTDRPAVATKDAPLRRLTPIEHERLQGFPDNWTNIPWPSSRVVSLPTARANLLRGTGLDGHRYHAVGNSMAVPVMGWIGQRMFAALQAQHTKTLSTQ